MLDVIRGFEQYEWFDEMFNTYHYPLLKNEDLLDYVHRFHREHEIVGADKYLWTWAQAHVQIWYTQKYLDSTVRWMPSRYPDGENMRMIAYTAFAAGCRGLLWFPSRYFSDEYHGADRYAEAGLIGCELEVIGPWLAEGTVGPKLETSEPDLHVWPVDFPGGRLLLVMTFDDKAQYHVRGEMGSGTVTLDQPVPENAGVYELSMGREPAPGDNWPGDGLNAARDTLDLPHFDMTSLILITSDETVLEQARECSLAVEADATRYATEALAAKIEKVEPVLEVIRAYAPEIGETESPVAMAAHRLGERMDVARHRLADARNAIEKGSYFTARPRAEEGRRALRHGIRHMWEALNENPFVRDAELLPNFYLAEKYYPLAQAIVEAERSANLLENPSFETTEDGRVAGWQNMAAGHSQTGARGLIDTARAGEAGLRFTSDSPTIYKGEERDWVTVNAVSDLVDVQQWDGLEATAWVHIGEDMRKTERGAVLQIAGYDEAGEAISSWTVTDVEDNHATATDGWVRLTARTVVTQADAKTVGVRIGICGAGEAIFDDVTLVRRRPELE
jgi:hypothetical protein